MFITPIHCYTSTHEQIGRLYVIIGASTKMTSHFQVLKVSRIDVWKGSIDRLFVRDEFLPESSCHVRAQRNLVQSTFLALASRNLLVGVH